MILLGFWRKEKIDPYLILPLCFGKIILWDFIFALFPRVKQQIFSNIFLIVAYTWLITWVLGIAMVRQESWRASVHKSSISHPNMSCWGATLVSTDKGWGCGVVYKCCNEVWCAWQLVCMLQSKGRAFGPFSKLQCWPLDHFLRLDLNSTN